MTPPTVSKIGFLAACFWWVMLVAAAGESAGDLVARGNAAYGEGRFDEALSLYDEASVTMPESARLYFNRGTVHYRMEDYGAAADDFKEAAVRAKDPVLTSRAKYNLGNCAFRNAQRQRDSDLKKAITHCEESIASYQEARDLDPDYREAAENIEIVRLYVKVLLDEQKKKEEEQQQQEEEQENLVEKLKKLIARQNELVGKNEGLRAALPNALDATTLESWKRALQTLTGEQATLRTDTGAVLGEMRQTVEQIRQQAAAGGVPGAPPQPAAPDATAFAEKIEVASGHVVNAMADEQLAETTLSSARQEPALGHQANAVQDLEEAVKALADEQEQQQQQQSGDQNQDQQDQDQEQEDQEQEDQEQEQSGENQEQQDQDQQNEQQQQQQGGDEEEQQEMEARAEQVDDILDEEKDNQKQRQPARPGRVRAVDKDW